MAADGSVIFSTELDESGLKSALGGLSKKVSAWTKGFGVTALKTTGVALGAVSTGLGALAKTAISYNSAMENYVSNFGVMLGNEAKAVEHVAELREMAAKTPFGMEELANASQTMLSFGMDAEYSMKAMQQLGDISLGNKERFGSLALAFSQVAAAGKLSGQDLLQMINAGFNPLNTIAEKTGTNLADLKEVMAGGKGSKEFRKQMKAAQKEVKKMGDQASEGAKMLAQIGQDGMISAEMVGLAMEAETSEGGRFYNGMLKASKTFSGMVSTLQDDATALVGKVFEPMTDRMTQSLLPMAQNYLSRLSEAFDSGGTTGLVAAFGNVLADAIGQAAIALPDVLSLSSNLLTAIGDGLLTNASVITTGLTNAINSIATSGLPETAIATLGTLAGTLISSLADGFSANATGILTGITNGLVGLLSGELPTTIVSSLFTVASSLVTGIATQLPTLLPAVATAIVNGIGTAFQSLPELATAAGNLITGLKNGLIGEAGDASVLNTIGQSIIDSLNTFFATHFPKLGIQLPDFETFRLSIEGAWTTFKGKLEELLITKLKILPEWPTLEKWKESMDSAYGSHGQEGDAGSTLGNFMMQLSQRMFGGEQSGLAMATGDLLGVSGPMENAVAADAENAKELAAQEGPKIKDVILESVAGTSEEQASTTGEGGAMTAFAQQSTTEFANGLEENAGTVATSMSNVISEAQNAADVGSFVGVGSQIVAGIAAGVTSGSGILTSAIKRVIQQALQAAKDEAVIKSPSRLFKAEVGVQIPAGAAEGVKMGAFRLYNAVSDMITGSIPDSRGIASNIISGGSYGASQAIAAATPGVFNQTNNFNLPVETPDEFAQTMRIYNTYGLAAQG